LKPVTGTIPRFNDETLPYHETYAYPNTNEGYEAAGLGLMNPYAATELILEKGKQVYTNFCVHCHGEKGDGKGNLVVKEKFLGVPNYKEREITEGSIFHVITYGLNSMGSHANQLSQEERWQVTDYVLKLKSQL
jgi:mono/diheme cytochrome c family protein